MDDTEQHFDLLPQHKQLIKDYARMLYGTKVSDEDIDHAQKKEPYINFNFRQAQYLRRSLIIEKYCFPMLNEARKKANSLNQEFEIGFMSPYFNEAINCFCFGSLLATICLCRSSLEVGLREVIAHARSKKNGTDLIDEYHKLEWELLESGNEGGLMEIAEGMGIIQEDYVNRIFTPLHLLVEMSNPKKYRKLLDKFIHGSYSELFLLVKEIKIEDSKADNYRDFIRKLFEMDKQMGLGLSFTIRNYFELLKQEQIAFYFLQGLFEFTKLIYFERINPDMA